ncbi:winged helix-turn-helix transcriptional regulator [Marinobacter xestospongiae]|uniref:winged helix-turn-helix transcriptional regulator n=1 Tax=Marinobacter xestospongiae TaxID=994319 RepID=UPI002004BD61|nr:helix-turn-helix domain-containing protein [Marinobacter xestospongiae]MCK7565564.1 helix-turn-helix transcriptional regulator [Marinobacter xestospongiae]
MTSPSSSPDPNSATTQRADLAEPVDRSSVPDDTRSAGQYCPLARGLELVGDRWSLVILREMALGRHRYGQFSEVAEAIPTNILASRLRKLSDHGLIRKVLYQERPRRYEYHFTSRGAALLPVMQALAQWGSDQLPECYRPPERFFQLTSADLLRAENGQS